MCGIVGYVGKREAVDVLLKGLKRLEYRGYDSAGIACFENEGEHKIFIHKSEGKLTNLEKNISSKGNVHAHCGIGHTRWATHGKPTTQNAHPHRTGHIVLVHNGIIENYQEIRAELIERGHVPQSETDSELFGFLVLEESERGTSFVESVRLSFLKLKGACSVVVLSEKDPGIIVGIRNGSPLVAANDPQGGSMLASDAQPMLDYTKEVLFLENGDVVVARENKLEIYDLESGKQIERSSSVLDWSAEKLDKQGYPYYMLKEIFEQPLAFVDTMNATLDRASQNYFPLAKQPGVEILKNATGLKLIACGTSWHAALLGKYWIERWAECPVEVELASEFYSRAPVIRAGEVVVGITQSGETADTLAVIREMKKKGIKTLGLTNTRGSTIAREADGVFYTAAGPEIGVASTKSFFSQMVLLLSWAGYLAQKDPKHLKQSARLFDQFIKLPHLLSSIIGEYENNSWIGNIKKVAKAVDNAKGFFFIGRGYSFPLALEGALKLKEIAYYHAEGYAGGELKHGPIAMIDEGMVLVVLVPPDTWREKTISNLQEVKARGARVIGIGDDHDSNLKSQCDYWIPTPTHLGSETIDESLFPFVLTPAIQLLSYELAVLRGTDVDQPRNLAKSVTVE